MSVRKASVLELATYAYELDAAVLCGVLERGQDGSWTVDGAPLEECLVSLEGQAIVFVAASLEDDRPMRAKTCRTCGRDYQGLECSHCRRVRRRLRGE